MKQFLHRMLCGVAGGSRMQCVTRDVPGRGGAGHPDDVPGVQDVTGCM